MCYCIFDLHRASYAELLETRKRLEVEKQFKMNIPEYLFQDPFENNPENLSKLESLKQIAREKILQYKAESTKTIIFPYYFIDRALQIGFTRLFKWSDYQSWSF